MSKDYYKILGVEKTASEDEIKKSFRRLAHQYHPDKKGGDEAKFKEVNEAYQVLSDSGKRAKYDQFGSDFEQQGGFGGGASWEDIMRQAQGGGGGVQFDFGGGGFGDIFGDMFGFGGGGARRRKGNDVRVDVEIDFHQVVTGVEKEIRLTKNNDCSVCSGSGAEPGSEMETCVTCKGRGQVVQMQRTILGNMQTAATCPTCLGQGQSPKKKCKHCGGTGMERKSIAYNVKIPAGIDDGQSIRLTGKGESAGSGGDAGDLYVVVHIKADKRFERDGINIFSDVTVSYPQAVLGDTISVETVDGTKQLVVPAGTSSGQRIRMKGYGVPHVHGSGRGDHYVTIIVDIPKKVSRRAKELLQELGEEL